MELTRGLLREAQEAAARYYPGCVDLTAEDADALHEHFCAVLADREESELTRFQKRGAAVLQGQFMAMLAVLGRKLTAE